MFQNLVHTLNADNIYEGPLKTHMYVLAFNIRKQQLYFKSLYQTYV